MASEHVVYRRCLDGGPLAEHVTTGCTLKQSPLKTSDPSGAASLKPGSNLQALGEYFLDAAGGGRGLAGGLGGQLLAGGLAPGGLAGRLLGPGHGAPPPPLRRPAAGCCAQARPRAWRGGRREERGGWAVAERASEECW